jgi:hypothetical protein
MDIVLCSDCFQDPGLRMDAEGFGVAMEGTCQVCRSDKGKKLDKECVAALVGSFFVWGTMLRCAYGSAVLRQNLIPLGRRPPELSRQTKEERRAHATDWRQGSQPSGTIRTHHGTRWSSKEAGGRRRRWRID